MEKQEEQYEFRVFKDIVGILLEKWWPEADPTDPTRDDDEWAMSALMSNASRLEGNLLRLLVWVARVLVEERG